MNWITKKNRGLLLFELETIQQFPIPELYISFTFFLILIYITISGSFSFTTSSIDRLPDLYEISFNVLQPLLLDLPLMLHGIFLSLLINNSFSSHESKVVMVNVLSFPVSRRRIFLFKYFYYFILGLIVSSFSLLIAFSLHIVPLKLEFLILVFSIFVINILFSLFIGILPQFFIIYNSFSNLLIVFFWIIKDLIFKKPLFDNLPDFLKFLFYPNDLVSSFQNKTLFFDVLSVIIGLLVIILVNIVLLKRFIKKDFIIG